MEYYRTQEKATLESKLLEKKTIYQSDIYQLEIGSDTLKGLHLAKIGMNINPNRFKMVQLFSNRIKMAFRTFIR